MEQSPLLCITVCSMGLHEVGLISFLCKQTTYLAELPIAQENTTAINHYRVLDSIWRNVRESNPVYPKVVHLSRVLHYRPAHVPKTW